MIQTTKQNLVELIERLPETEIPAAHRFIEYLIQQNEDRFLDEIDAREAKQILDRSSEKDWVSWSQVEAELQS